MATLEEIEKRPEEYEVSLVEPIDSNLFKPFTITPAEIKQKALLIKAIVVREQYETGLDENGNTAEMAVGDPEKEAYFLKNKAVEGKLPLFTYDKALMSSQYTLIDEKILYGYLARHNYIPSEDIPQIQKEWKNNGLKVTFENPNGQNHFFYSGVTQEVYNEKKLEIDKKISQDVEGAYRATGLFRFADNMGNALSEDDREKYFKNVDTNSTFEIKQSLLDFLRSQTNIEKKIPRKLFFDGAIKEKDSQYQQVINDFQPGS